MTATAKKKKAKPSVNLKPLGDRVVVERDESDDVTSGGIVLPQSAKDKPARGVVISIGDGRLNDDGTRAELQVKVGDRVIFTSYGPEELKVGQDEFLLMSETDILAVVE